MCVRCRDPRGGDGGIPLEGIKQAREEQALTTVKMLAANSIVQPRTTETQGQLVPVGREPGERVSWKVALG